MIEFKTLLAFGTALAAQCYAADEKWDIKKLDLSKLPAPSAQKGVTYAKDIRPLFEASCFRCHGEEQHKGDLRVDSLEGVLKGGEDGKVVVPGNSKNSLLVAAVAQVHEDVAMPPKFRPRPGGPGGPGGAGGPGGFGGGPRGGGNREGAPGPTSPGGPGPGGQRPGGPGGPGRGGPPPKPLTSEQVALVRAWIDQGAK